MFFFFYILSKESPMSVPMTDMKRKIPHRYHIEKRSRQTPKAARAPVARTSHLASLNRYQLCSICLGSKLLTEFPAPEDLPTTCAHAFNICRACISRSVADDLARKPRDRIGCPEYGARWDDHFLKLYAEAKAFAVFEALDVLRVLEAMPDFRQCLRPGCNGGQLHEAGEAAPIVTCIKCGHKTCFTHRVAWHTGLSCADFDASEETKEQTRDKVQREEEEVRESVRPCPHCNVDIEKDGGCDHMYCESTRRRT